jgi:hypothetical protein|tara:strand:- start:568 stop:1230 length:663 start_codon:yes stop_codon:yes gene_type:complete
MSDAMEFQPGESGKDCSEKAGGWGLKSTRYDYIWKGDIDESKYPEDACDPRYHGNAQIDNLQVNTNLTSPAASITNITGNINVQSWKGFDIKHPNKEGQRLRHICLEGPEAGVYIRGKLTDNNVIDLPDYWSGLVDPESITVSLTQIGSSQDLIVDKIEWGRKVYVRSGNASTINCFYTIQASRIDGEPLIVEYEGETPAEYPGGSRQFSISGYDYDARG